MGGGIMGMESGKDVGFTEEGSLEEENKNNFE